MSNVIHVVERIDDKYGGPAKSIPYTALFSATPTSEHVICAGRYDENDRNSVCEQSGLTCRQFDIVGPTKIAFSPGLCLAIFRFVRGHEHPIVHVHNAWNFVPFFVWLLSFFADFKIVVSVRGALFPWSMEQGRTRKALAWKLFQKRLLKKADVVHVTSQEESEQVCQLGICDNLLLIPNGVCLQSVHTDARHVRKASAGGSLRLLFVSRIHPKKGFEILLSALASKATDFDVELVVAGDFSDDAYREKIEAFLGELTNNVTVRFLGHVSLERLTELYDTSDLFVLPSYTENFGIAIAEALGHGLPVVTTVHTPWLEVKTRNAGYVIETSAEQLAAALVDFHGKSGDQRAEMSNNARELIAKYDWQHLAANYQQMYADLA